jgi:hypothetical protein
MHLLVSDQFQIFPWKVLKEYKILKSSTFYRDLWKKWYQNHYQGWKLAAEQSLELVQSSLHIFMQHFLQY